jgi:putative transposase
MARPGHLSTFDYQGLHRYFLTYCTHARVPHFVDPQTVGSTLSQFLRAADTEECALLAYCFMPDHVHLLVEGMSDASRGLRFMALAKQLSGYAHHRRRRAPLWQRDSYERALRDDEGTLAVAKYILMNPVRGGLAQAPLDYPFSGSARYSREQLVELLASQPGEWQPQR